LNGDCFLRNILNKASAGYPNDLRSHKVGGLLHLLRDFEQSSDVVFEVYTMNSWPTTKLTCAIPEEVYLRRNAHFSLKMTKSELKK